MTITSFKYYLERQLRIEESVYNRLTDSGDKGLHYESTMKPLENYIHFIESIAEITFGDNAENKAFTLEEIIQRVQDFSDDALTYENNHKYKLD